MLGGIKGVKDFKVAEKPANEKLWAMIIAQAKAKFSTYPNPAASHWVHTKYEQSGGKFIDTSNPVYKQQVLQKKQFEKKQESRSAVKLGSKKKGGKKQDDK
jgi:hypothetical protein